MSEFMCCNVQEIHNRCATLCCISPIVICVEDYVKVNYFSSDVIPVGSLVNDVVVFEGSKDYFILFVRCGTFVSYRSNTN
jgi:hypothetical protein